MASKPARRERQILELVFEGLTDKEIATKLKLTPETIRSYRKTLMKKLDAHNVAMLIRRGLEAGLLKCPAAKVAVGD
jgi:DNA-binding NarL/FixJ family response regulator